MKGFKFLLKFSYRNLGRSPKRTLIMLFSLSIGTSFIIWDLNFSNSGSREVVNSFLKQYAGVYHVTHPNYYNKTNTKEFNNYKTISDDLITDENLKEKSTKRVTAPVFISGEKKTLGVLLTGIESTKEKKLSLLHESLKEGRFPDETNAKEIVLGKKLAQRINVSLGDEVVIIGQGLDGSVANELLKVVGLLDFGGGDLEESLAFTQLQTAQELLSMSPESYHQRVSFDVTNPVIPQFPNLAVTTWDKLMPDVSVSITFLDKCTWLTCIIIVIVISLGLSNTLMITFFEREQEFQSLNIIGAKMKWITLSLLLEVFMMGTVAICLGVGGGHLLTTYFSHYPINIQLFTGGKPIIMGGMTIVPTVRFFPVAEYYWKVPLMIYFFLSMTMLYPLMRVIRRSKNAI